MNTTTKRIISSSEQGKQLPASHGHVPIVFKKFRQSAREQSRSEPSPKCLDLLMALAIWYERVYIYYNNVSSYMYNIHCGLHHKYDLLIHQYVHIEIKVFALKYDQKLRGSLLPPPFYNLNDLINRVLKILSKSQRIIYLSNLRK